ncbi:MAG: 4-alpha-glucanotransferase, partial [Myxococcota bacterium]
VPAGGGARRRTSDATREALLAAMDVDASSEARAREALRAQDARRRERLLEPVRVTQQGDPRADTLAVRAGGAGPVEWRAELLEEDGRRSLREGRGARVASVPLPKPRSLGYHRLRVRVTTRAGSREAEQRWIVVPPAAGPVREVVAGRRATGLTANLYSVRSADNLGVGDLGDARALVRLAAERGDDFVGLNPLCALWNRDTHVVPYAPLSRLFRNELYLEVRRIPELRSHPGVRRSLEAPVHDRARAASHLDHLRLARRKRALLRELHAVFAAQHRGRSTRRGAAYAAFLRREGPALRRFAVFVALGESRAARGQSLDWRRWPAALRRPDAPEVARFAERHAEAVDFHCWVQFELDRQLAGVADAARWRGLAIGLYTDLPIGADAGGFDAWAQPDLFSSGASVGAPPDDFAVHGQDWGVAPMVPEALRADGFRAWSELLRRTLAHAGAVRIDHAMGLERLFWVPKGRPAGEGAYVRQPAAELLGILALESRRSGAIVVGEDLGTVPRGLRGRLARRNVLSTRVLVFERDGARFRPASRYPRGALVGANTHDLVPLAGLRDAVDVELRRRAGQLSAREAADARRERQHLCDGLLARLQRDGLLPPDLDALPPWPDLLRAVSAFLARTPSALVATALDDLAGEREPVNLPGVAQGRHRSWTRRMRASLEEIAAQPSSTSTGSMGSSLG